MKHQQLALEDHKSIRRSFNRFAFYFLLALHSLLALWALVGFSELVFTVVPWPRVSNPEFPGGILVLQWSLTLIAAVTFIVGYITRWRHFAIAMTCIYVTMAAVCALETFKYMTSSLRYVAMVLEYLAYATILLFLYRSDSFGKRLR